MALVLVSQAFAEFVPPAPVHRMDRTKLQIGAYCLAPQYRDETRVKELRDCGIDFLYGVPANDRATLDLFAKYGLGCFAAGGVPFWHGMDGKDAGKMKVMRPMAEYEKAIAAFQDHPAIWAADYVDEPSAFDFPYIAEVTKLMNEKMPRTIPYINLYPNYARAASTSSGQQLNQLGTATYKEYIDAYVMSIPLDYICYDFYLYAAKGAEMKQEFHEKFYTNLEDVSDACHRTGKSLWFIPQVNSLHKELWLSENMLRFQAFAAMAYGAEVINWACWSIVGEGESPDMPGLNGWWENNVLTLDGKKTEQYDKLKKVNAEIHCLARPYMRYRNVATHRLGFGKEVRKDVGGFKCFGAARADAKILVGEMASRDGRGEAIFLMNASDPFDEHPSVTEMTFRAEGLVEVFGPNGQQNLAKNADGAYELSLPANQAVLIRALPMRFPVLGWYSCPPSVASVEYYKEAHDAGFSVLMQFCDKGRNLKMLDMAQEANIQLKLTVPWHDGTPDETVMQCKGHPALWMWHVTDEPHARLWKKVGDACERIKRLDERHGYYVNMNPYSTNVTSRLNYLGVDDYREYLERALDEMRLPFLSIDNYPTSVRSKLPVPKVIPAGPWQLKPSWYKNLEIARDVAEERNVPLWLFARNTSMFFGDDMPVPTRSTLRLEVYSALAYGAKAIQYFTFYTPDPGQVLLFHDGCITTDGKRGLAYDRVKRMNRELHARFDRLVGAESVGVWHTEPLPEKTKRLETLPPFVKSLKAEGALVALLRQGHHDILMVVNRSPNEYMRLDIELEKGVKRILEDGVAIDADRYGTIYRLEPGYAEMFITKK